MREFTLKVRGNRTKMRERAGDGSSEIEVRRWFVGDRCLAMVPQRQRRRWLLGYKGGDGSSGTKPAISTVDP